MTALAALSLAVWIYLVAGRGGFWRIAPDLLPPATAGIALQRPSVLAVVPARNEAPVLRDTLSHLLAQDYSGAFHVLVVDDGSEDGTGMEALRLAAESGLQARLSVFGGAPLPPGWAGKVWAMRQGLDRAGAQAEPPDLILFTDADIRHAPDVLSRLVALLGRRGVVLASLMVLLRTQSTAEKLLVPAFVYFFRMLYPFAQVGDPMRTTAAAAGGAMLVDRKALVASGGFEPMRGALIDDCALGARMKGAGPIWLGMTRDARSVRAYPRIADVGHMISRSAYAELRYSPVRLAAALLGLGLVFAVPPLAAIFASGWARLAGCGAFVLMIATFVPMLRFYRLRVWLAVLLPAVAAGYAWFTVASAVQHWNGRGGSWKGRIQARTERSVGT